MKTRDYSAKPVMRDPFTSPHLEVVAQVGPHADLEADAGSVRFKLDQPASFAFYRYRVEGG